MNLVVMSHCELYELAKTGPSRFPGTVHLRRNVEKPGPQSKGRLSQNSQHTQKKQTCYYGITPLLHAARTCFYHHHVNL
jgi:hypothetical protein